MALQGITPYTTSLAATGLSLAAGMSPQTAAIVAIATYAIENTPRAAAGPLAYASCVAGCSTMAPPFIPGCIALCLPALALPSP